MSSIIPQNYYMPAEWEPHEATWLTWPKDPITWPNRIPQAEEVYTQMIEALTPAEKVHLLVDDEKSEQYVRQKLKGRNIHFENLLLHQIKTSDSWIRDYGPNFLKRKKEISGIPEIAYNDWIFNAWGDKYETLKRDNAIPQQLEDFLKMPRFEPGIVLEGGSIEVNGAGCVLTTEQCLLNQNRNPKLFKNEIEKYLQDFLGVQKVLWLGEGIAGDDTDGHIDDITRFVNERTIVTVIEKDPLHENYEPLQENLKKLKSFTDAQEKPFEILTLPMPHSLHDDENEVLPASYANFYIANEVVLVPIFLQSRDEEALTTLQQVFPNRKVIGLDCRDLIWGMGALHCLSQQQPKF
ncbi:MAG: agmatine deiminase family protein [Deltaproteobacteria bacterium]|nr:agmatine deiminase family protein [Deltaproteobacteria bacterium]